MISFLVYQFSLEKKKRASSSLGEREGDTLDRRPRSERVARPYAAHTCAHLRRDERWPPPSELDPRTSVLAGRRNGRTRGRGPSQRLTKRTSVISLYSSQ